MTFRKKSRNGKLTKAARTESVESKVDEMNEEEEIQLLTRRAREEAPDSGSQQKSDKEKTFSTMPISRRTLEALKIANLINPTDIQAAAIPHALAGRDILGAAKTGSGKTLAFVIPVIERLFVERWSVDDGLAAVIVTPTRELALQIFDVLRIVGKKHQLSAGLVTGGKREFEMEQERILKMNILVATPGRLLQHLEETPGFDASQVLILVLDEADRILDMGFKQQLDGILQYLPPRQTLLFSATQTKSVKDLARLSLKRPEYLAVHADDENVTPAQLKQNYIVCKLQDKLDILFSFIKTHLKDKIIVFFSTCSQVRFVYECFRGMQPGIPLTALHGKVKQERRTIIYMDYTRRKAACMFATDIAARGLDFPNVDWVVQVDAPEDAAMYIHRVGRTARYNAGGRALLMLMPTEAEPISQKLTTAGVPIQKLTVNPKFTFSVATHAAALLAAQPECRKLAKKAFTGYLRSLQLMPGMEHLDMASVPVAEFATSLGLGLTPPVPLVPGRGLDGREANREAKNVNRALDKLKKQIKEAKEAKRAAREARKKELGLGGDPPTAAASGAAGDTHTGDQAKKGNGDDDDDLLTVKKVHRWGEGEGEGDDDAFVPLDTKSKKRVRTKIKPEDTIKVMREAGAKRTVFDDEGEVVAPMALKTAGGGGGGGVVDEAAVEAYARRVRARVDAGREEDEAADQQRVREMHKLRRTREKQERVGDGEQGRVAVLGGGDESGDDEDDDDDDEEQSHGEDDEDDEDGDDDDQMSDDSDDDDGDIADEDESDDDEGEEEDKEKRRPSGRRGRFPIASKGSKGGVRASVGKEEMQKQEALALKLLG